MSVRQYEEERQKREEILKRENNMLERHKGELIEKIWTLESEIYRLREALEFYADENNNRHKLDFKLYQWDLMSEVAQDEGEKARQALKGGVNNG